MAAAYVDVNTALGKTCHGKKVICPDVSKKTPVIKTLTIRLPIVTGKGTVEERVAQARNGDLGARDDLVRDYIPFILKTAASVVKRYIVMGHDDEASIALAAFNEAIDAYVSPNPGFLAFAATVIKRRLIDYYRKEKRHAEVPFSSLATQSNDNSDTSEDSILPSVETQEEWQKIVERRDEIERWKLTLSEFGLTLRHVARVVPKHVDARERAKKIALQVVTFQDLKEKFMKDKKLPVDDILERLPNEDRLSRKTLERHKSYITAMAIVLAYEFPSLREYLGGTEGW